jgi:aminomethyltransferase
VQTANGKRIGVLSDFAYSHRFSKNIGVGLIATDIESDAQDLVVLLDGVSRKIDVAELPFGS